MNSNDILNDPELFLRLKNGDANAFVALYDRYWTSLFLHARKLLRDDNEAEDVVQELFSKLWLKRETLDITGSVAAYLYSSVRRRVLNVIVHKKIVTDYAASLQVFAREGELVTDDWLREKELAQLIEKEIQALPEKMRQVFELSRKQHFTYAEIAQQLGITEHTVKSQVSNALRILRLKLNVSAGIIVLLLHHR